MSQSYIVQSGDTLLKIAIDNDVPFTTLLELNPKYQPNPDLIHVGDSIHLPEEIEDEEVEQTNTVEPISKVRPTAETCTLMAAPECEAKEVHDVVFVTGEAMTDFYCLDEKSIQYMDEEAKCMDSLLEGYATLLKETPQGKNVTKQQVEQHAKKRQVWLNDASNAGAICLVESTEAKIGRKVASAFGGSTEKKNDENIKRVDARLEELRKKKTFVEEYSDTFFLEEDSLIELRRRVLTRIQSEIDDLTALSHTVASKKNSPEKPNNQSVNTDNFNSEGKNLVSQKNKRHLVEVYSVKHDKYVYLRSEFVEQEQKRWKPVYKRSNTMQALEQNDKAGFAKAIKEDIKNNIKTSLKDGPVAMKLNEWKADGGHWREFQSKKHLYNDDGKLQFAISKEAQLFRWGAQAAATVKKADIGIGAEASFSLAEATVAIKAYIPYQSGYPVTLSYIDAKGKDATYSFGCFRLNSSMQLSAFTGVMASVMVKGEVPKGDGSIGVLFSPRVGVSTSAKGQVGFKAEGFAGAQAGGELCGGVEWQSPPEDEQKLKPEFKSLAEVKGGGNIAAGLGSGADFQLSLRGQKFYFVCSGRLVWGVGGSGSFGAVIDGGEIWELAKIILKGLQCVGYRQLGNIDKLAYRHLVRASYLAFASDMVQYSDCALQKAIEKSVEKVNEFWDERDRQKEAEYLAQRILEQSIYSETEPNQLLPEVIGIMLETLVEEFLLSMNEKQEMAICVLLKQSTYNWRKFEEILSRMNSTGEKQIGEQVLFTNLSRINEILDGGQQREFNSWVCSLAEDNDQVISTILTPFTSPLPNDRFEKKQELIAMIKESNEGMYV
ncbi:LysM peptidoglycan-binding domain-containing protein [Aliivibrio sifiae]|uniref:LysM domain-containing protein n=1 Tax=Aliivibrio sifiae TaxID=566293 RepID=A0A2S7XIQ9_9GAMM|nr:LysM domain-containing protein [Aliivibrio sifiae]PQJ93358.1 hypothetical protein BTO23_04495 [Aliivibrio sifiae]GLR74561.1 hypothetical protein GCM10007855_14350 [Aliivibrio sifiae]